MVTKLPSPAKERRVNDSLPTGMRVTCGLIDGVIFLFQVQACRRNAAVVHKFPCVCTTMNIASSTSVTHTTASAGPSNELIVPCTARCGPLRQRSLFFLCGIPWTRVAQVFLPGGAQVRPYSFVTGSSCRHFRAAFFCCAQLCALRTSYVLSCGMDATERVAWRRRSYDIIPVVLELVCFSCFFYGIFHVCVRTICRPPLSCVANFIDHRCSTRTNGFSRMASRISTGPDHWSITFRPNADDGSEERGALCKAGRRRLHRGSRRPLVFGTPSNRSDWGLRKDVKVLQSYER